MSKPIEILYCKFLWFKLRIRKSTDGGWWITKKDCCRIYYKIALNKAVADDGLSFWIVFFFNYKIMIY